MQTPRCLRTSVVLPICLASSGAILPAQQLEFAAPIRLKAGDHYVKVEAPGYAAPCWADVDADGKKDLIVGQFKDGKMSVFRNLGDGKLAAGKWLEAGGEIAKVPGIW